MSSPSASLESGLNKKRTAVKLSGFALFFLSFQTLGIIYSDIGTSPLYVLNGIWPASGDVPPKEDIIGGISAIIWSLTLLPLIKYVFISLMFGTQEGEGGSYALYQGLYPPEDYDGSLDRTLTGDSYKVASHKPTTISERFRLPLLAWCLFGTALTIADGMFTPAVSVTSAVGGIAVAKASVSAQIIPISIVILLVLFIAQRFGTASLSFMFAPISFIWFLLLAGTGAYNITSHPAIFRAVDPSRAVMLFVRTGDYDILAGVLLAVTGCEAIFANLGQFNAMSIRISFAGFVYPSLVLAYLGQGARLIVGGDAILSNIFYTTIPGPANGPLFWIVFVFAILATIIASQAMITATFSLIQQLVNMKALPPLKMSYTSETIQGQVYISSVNWTLMVGTIIVVAAFSNLANLTNAYGFAVATVMFSTSILLAVQMRWVKQWPAVIAIGYFILWGFFDGLFWGASLKKVPRGAWVPLMIGIILMLIMSFWTWAKGLEDKFDGEHRENLRHFIIPEISQDEPEDEDTEETEGEDIKAKDLQYFYRAEADGEKGEREHLPLVRLPTCAVFHKFARGQGAPHTFTAFVRQWPALPRVVIFLSVSVVPVAHVSSDDRYAITKVRTVQGFYGVTAYLGFRDDFDIRADDMIEKICALELQMDPRQLSGTVNKIRAVARSTTHIAPHYHVISKYIDAGRLSPVLNWCRKYLIEDIYRRLVTMFPETANWLFAEEIIRVGINAKI
ncbi:potassium transporter [Mycena metata]|uniref:Potassium transporter n=1 Tax=Mycena metata TaxID=1033252 RepID=A0AAD7DUT1_9AGAR|nr:potassium transporter [Mycena metata]KAJ7784271.1 potassium transporter [Mycena metata]